MTSKIDKDLLAILGVTALLILIITVTPDITALRVVLGLPFLLLFPGYTLIAALFPRKTDLDGIERTALSFGLSIAVVPLVGLVLNYTPWGIRLYPILISLALLIAALSALAWYRRRTYPPQDRFTLDINFKMPSFQGQTGVDKALSVVLVVAIVASIGTLGYVIASPKTGERFTEFYILGTEGKADRYPGEFVYDGDDLVTVRYRASGETVDTTDPQGRVILGIINREHEEAEYRVEVVVNGERLDFWLDGEAVQSTAPVVLEHDEKWEQEIGFVPPLGGLAVLSAAASEEDTVLHLSTVEGFAAGDKVLIRDGSGVEHVEIEAVDSGASTVTLTSELKRGHAAGATVVEQLKVQFVLYKDGVEYFEDGRSLHLWVTSYY